MYWFNFVFLDLYLLIHCFIEFLIFWCPNLPVYWSADLLTMWSQFITVIILICLFCVFNHWLDHWFADSLYCCILSLIHGFVHLGFIESIYSDHDPLIYEFMDLRTIDLLVYQFIDSSIYWFIN